MNQGGQVFEGSWVLVLTNGWRVPISWRSRKGAGCWITAKGHGVFFGKTLKEVTLALAAANERP